MKLNTITFLLASVTLPLPAHAQVSADLTPLAAGRQLAAQLTLQQDLDAGLFQQIGSDAAKGLLMAVVAQGHEPSATPVEWTQLHRALDGLVELEVSRGKFVDAATFAKLQGNLYRGDEIDYTAALKAARTALDLQERSGVTATLYVLWTDIGEDLILLGRLEEGLAAFNEAHRRDTNLRDWESSDIWRDLIDAEIACNHLDAAHRESDAFSRQAEDPRSEQLFRQTAWMARADLALKEARYNDAVDDVHSAAKPGPVAVAEEPEIIKRISADPPTAETALALSRLRESFAGLEAAGKAVEDFMLLCASETELRSLAAVALQSLPYGEAKALIGRIEREFPDLSTLLADYVNKAVRHRRILAGDFEGLLREDAAALEQARQANNVPGQIAALTDLAVTYSFAHSPLQQIALLEEAVTLRRSLQPAGVIPSEALFSELIALGNAYASNKNSSKARKCFDEVTKGIEAFPQAAAQSRLAPIYGQAQLGKALVEELEDDPEKARTILRAALSQAPGGKTDDPRKFTRADVLFQLARLERHLNEKPLDAVRYYEDAIQEVHLTGDTGVEISLRLQLARYLAVEAAKQVPDSQTRAAEQVKLAEGSATSMEFADALWRVRFLAGILAQNSGKSADAITLYKQSVERLDQLRAGLPQDEQRQAFMDNDSVQELYQRLIALLTAANRPAEAWEYLERGKARAFLEGLQGRRFRPSALAAGTDAAKSLAALEDAMVGLRQLISQDQLYKLQLQLSGNDQASLRGPGVQSALRQGQLHDLEAHFAAARQQTALTFSRQSQPLSLRPITFVEMQNALPAGSALIEYAVLDGSMAAFIATATGVKQIQWTANTKALPGNIGQLRGMLAAGNPDDPLDPLLRELSAVLITPVANALPAGIDRLLIVPAQSLYNIPFQALMLPDGRAMIDQFAISYLPSASTLQFLKTGPHAAAGDIFLGALGNLSVDGLDPLPGTVQETAGIEKLFPQAERASEGEFTHDRAVKALLEHDQVHFATHGKAEEGAPLFSAIVTAPQEGSPSRLSLYEVMDMNLRARLVVLSACETDLGKMLRGDEIAGLTRTFLQAGAETVVSSLWRVSDESTAMLMQGFYERLKEGKSAAVSLRESALEVRKKFPHPFYWAAFVETGID